MLYTKERLVETLLELLIFNQESFCSTLELIKLYTLKERELYTQLNHLKMKGSLFIGDLWIPT